MTTPEDQPRPDVDRKVVEALLGRRITDDEWDRVQILLDLMWLEAVDAKPCPEAIVKPTAVGALAESVADITNNPNKYRSESEGDYSYSTAVGEWSLAALPDLLRRIWGGCNGVGSGVFSIMSVIRRWP